jgi:hypothetical protein
LPFHIASLPPGLTISTGAHLTTQPTFGSSPATPVYTWQADFGGSDSKGDFWQISAEPYFAPNMPSGGADVTHLVVDGHSAQTSSLGLTVFDDDGMTVTLKAAGAYLADIEAKGGYVALFHQTTLLGVDQANWTTHVLG